MAMNFLRKAYVPTSNTDRDGDEDDDALQMNESDIFKAMNQLQHDDSMPQETRDLINQISQKFDHNSSMHDIDDVSSPLDSEIESIPSPTASDMSELGQGATNPKTVDAIKQITHLLHGVASRQTHTNHGPADMPDRDFLHAKGVAAFAGYPAKSVYQEGNGFDAVPDISAELDHSTGPSTPVNYKEAKNPQDFKYHPSRNFLIGVSVINIICGILYIYWRCTRSMTGVMHSWFAWVFLFGEIVITLSAWQSHCSRFFPVKRTRCTVDDL
ncbi:hypothetical protein VYU27_009392, partial [Nannochloropsis oceanica]